MTKPTRSAVLTLLGVALTACGSAGEDPRPSATSSTSQAVETVADVPNLTCTSLETLGRPLFSLRVVASGADSSTGTALLRRYYLVDGQSYLVGSWQVTAVTTRDATGGELLVVRDAAGLFDLQVEADGGAALKTVTYFGFPMNVALRCAPSGASERSATSSTPRGGS